MTIRVKIEHTQPGYDRAITVQEMYMDVTGEWKPREHESYRHVVEPGQTKDWVYVHTAQALLITEGPAATPQPPANAE